MNSALRLLSIPAIVLICVSATDAAPFEGFESGLGSFAPPTTDSIAQTETGASNGIAASEGASYAVLETLDNGSNLADRGFGAVSSTSELETFLGLSAGDIDDTQTAGGVSDLPTGGSAIQQTFSVSVGDVISFDYLFLTNEYTSVGSPDPNAGNDFAFAVLDGITFLLDGVREGTNGNSTDFTAAPSGSGYLHMANGGLFQTFVLPAVTSTSATLSFAIVNVIDQTRSSGLFIDNITITPASSGGGSVPEPTSLALLMLGTAGILARRRSTSPATMNV